MITKRRLIGGLALLVLAACLAGCGASGEAQTPSTRATASTEQLWVDANDALDGMASRQPEPSAEIEVEPRFQREPREVGAPHGLPDGVEPAVVTRIVDGDTLEVLGKPGGNLLSASGPTMVRLLEIDTPETKHPSEPHQCYGDEATTHLAKLAPPGHTVWVLADRQLLDPYARHLLYLWTSDGETTVFVNQAMVAGGYATAVLYEPNDLYIEEMRRAERRARAATIGLWKECAYFGEPSGS